ncbi:MAG: thioredoxin [Proteobacteria bacterium]|nr:MAG: thioredoxin [Pseudomonadota bacterium]
MKDLCRYLLLIMFAIALTGCKEQKMEIGKPAPDIAAKNARGELVHLDDYKGKAILLEFLSKTCGACLLSIPKFNKIQAENRDRLVVLTVATDLTESELDDFAKENDMKYPLVADQLGITQERYQIMGYPTLMFLNREHILESIEQGVTTNPNWFEKVSLWANSQY